MIFPTYWRIAILTMVLVSAPIDVNAQEGEDALVLRALEAFLAFDLPPAELTEHPWGRVLAAEMWHAHALDNPGPQSGRCHAAKELRRAESLSIAGPAALAAQACGDGITVGIPEVTDPPPHSRIVSKGHLKGTMRDFGVQCFGLKRAPIQPGPSELLIRSQGAVWIEGETQKTRSVGLWTHLKWPEGSSQTRVCVLPSSLQMDIWFAMRNQKDSVFIQLTPSARLLRALFHADRDEAQKILEESDTREEGETFTLIRRAVGQRWPSLINVNPGAALPLLAGSDLSRRIASHLRIRTRIDEGEFATALAMVRAQMGQMGNAGHFLKAKCLEGLGWEYEARVAITDALTGMHGHCQVRLLARELKVEIPPLIGTCTNSLIEEWTQNDLLLKRLTTRDVSSDFHLFLTAPIEASHTEDFDQHPTLIVGHRYWVDFQSSGDSLVFRRSLFKIHTPRGAVSVQRWDPNSEWTVALLIRKRVDTPPEFGQTVQGNPGLILDDVLPGDEVEIVQYRLRNMDAFVGPGANFERLACSDRLFPVASCSVEIRQDAGAQFPLHVVGQTIECERTRWGHRCDGGPWEPAPREPDASSPWDLLAHVQVTHKIPRDVRLARARVLVESALLSARRISYYGAIETPEELHMKILEAPPRGASSPEASLGLDPRDMDLLAGLIELGEPGFVAHIPDFSAHDSILGLGLKRVVVPRGPEQGSIWWTTSLPLPFANQIPALDQGRRTFNLGPNTGPQRLKAPVQSSTGGAIIVDVDLVYDEDNRSLRGSMSLKWTGVFAISSARSQHGLPLVAKHWVNVLLPGLNSVGEAKIYFGGEVSAIEAILQLEGSDIRPEEVAIQVAHPQALANLLHHERRMSYLTLGHGIRLKARLTVDRVEGRDMDPRSEIRIHGAHAAMTCVRRYIAGRKVDLRCDLNVPATHLKPGYWPTLHQLLGEISDHQRVPLIE
jgi:hypothetical protein